MYDINTQLAVEREIAGSVTELVPFVRPHFYALLIAPLSLLPYQAAFWSWICLQAALLGCCWAWARRRFGPDALILCCLFFPTAGGIFVGQDCVFLTVIVIAAYLLHERGWDFWSGVVLGLALFKFHLVLLLPLAMVLDCVRCRKNERATPGSVESAQAMFRDARLLRSRIAGHGRLLAKRRRSRVLAAL